MDFLKKHYEKIALSVVLLAVAVIAFSLTKMVGDVRTTLDEQLRARIGGKQKSLQPADLTNSVLAFERLSKPFEVRLAGDHNTFNPVTWVKLGDTFKRMDNKGALFSVLRINPLPLKITYVGVAGTGDPYRYQFSVEKTYEKLPTKRRPITVSLTEGTKNDLFVLREIKGPKENPSEVVVELLDGGNRVVLAKDKTFSKTSGHSADLRGETNNREYPGKRPDDTILLPGGSYKIISISADEVIIQAPNNTRSTLRPASNP